MKKKFLEIIRMHGFTLVDYETWRLTFDWRSYQIKYKNRKGIQFDWFGRIDRLDDDMNSMENKHGILIDFEKHVILSRGGL
jgi:hypothetical protein